MNQKRGRRPANRHDRSNAAQQPSTYIRPFKINPGDKVWLWCRVSTGRQNATGNNDDQEAELRDKVKAHGGIVVGVTPFVGKASDGVTLSADADAWLYRAANCAAKFGAVLLAESPSRFARHLDYNPKEPRPCNVGFCALRNLHLVCGDVALMTLHHPDSTHEVERGDQSKRGQRRKEKRGGRPPKRSPGYKKQERERLLPEVGRLVSEGWSNRAIARELAISETNVRRWAAPFLLRKRADGRV